VQDNSREACVREISSISAGVSIEHRLVTDRQTDGHTAMANTVLA